MSPEESEKFPKSARLRKRPEFLQLSRTGRKIHSAHFVIVSGKNDCGETRVGITVSGKVGNSVVRNRIKRSLREFFRRHRRELGAGLDFLVIARKSASKISSSYIAEEMSQSLIDYRSQRN
ncbi:MAG: ribonuclease P protein component [Deltaproteobacteria bacterium]|nr:ribonuclease P protein component [Deltaproteobacteria bacterium]